MKIGIYIDKDYDVFTEEEARNWVSRDLDPDDFVGYIENNSQEIYNYIIDNRSEKVESILKFIIDELVEETLYEDYYYREIEVT